MGVCVENEEGRVEIWRRCEMPANDTDDGVLVGFRGGTGAVLGERRLLDTGWRGDLHW